jgi:hexosaminidase
MNKALDIVARHGKTAVAWHQLVKVPGAASDPTAVAQYWGTDQADPDISGAVADGRKLILSPARTAYLDMKYDASTALGLKWAGFIEVRDAYDWDPVTYLDDVPAESVVGVEAPLWTETVRTMRDAEFLALPRLAAVAEVGWSDAAGRDWTDFRTRLAALGRRWAAAGVDFHRSPQVDWDE